MCRLYTQLAADVAAGRVSGSVLARVAGHQPVAAVHPYSTAKGASYQHQQAWTSARWRHAEAWKAARQHSYGSAELLSKLFWQVCSADMVCCAQAAALGIPQVLRMQQDRSVVLKSLCMQTGRNWTLPLAFSGWWTRPPALCFSLPSRTFGPEQMRHFR